MDLTETIWRHHSVRAYTNDLLSNEDTATLTTKIGASPQELTFC